MIKQRCHKLKAKAFYSRLEEERDKSKQKKG